MLHLLPPLFRSGKGKAKAAASHPHPPINHRSFIAPKAAAESLCAITAAAERLLAKAVTFEDGGYGSSVSCFGGRTHIEWRNLTVARISNAAVTDMDGLAGITGRYYVHLSCDAHRRWNANDNRWTAWEAGGYAIFPGVIVVERVHGRCLARAEGLENFSPGHPRSRPVDGAGMEMSLAI